VLGMKVTFGPGRTALTFRTGKIKPRGRAGVRAEALRPTPGSADVCLIVDDDIGEVIAGWPRLESRSEGPVARRRDRADRQLPHPRPGPEPHPAQQLRA
jgi:hypothetical protein